jgi:hypothetical protein
VDACKSPEQRGRHAAAVSQWQVDLEKRTAVSAAGEALLRVAA